MNYRVRWGVVDLLRCEVSDLTTPATAGRLRPVVLLPGDWRSWSVCRAPRRARARARPHRPRRLRHRAAGPARRGAELSPSLVRWMAARLQLQQEQAADALGARFAGGPTRYLVALSSLALRQDGRSPCWPARAFLPARDPDQEDRHVTGWIRLPRPSNGHGRERNGISTAVGLLGLTIGLATLRGPGPRAEDGPSTAAKVEASARAPRSDKALRAAVFREGADALAIVRPAAISRHERDGSDHPLVWSGCIWVRSRRHRETAQGQRLPPGFPEAPHQGHRVSDDRPHFGRGRAPRESRSTRSCLAA